MMIDIQGASLYCSSASAGVADARRQPVSDARRQPVSEARRQPVSEARDPARAPPLVTLHGGLGLDHSYLRPWLDELAVARQVVYYDQRGNGRSQDLTRTPLSHDVL